MKKKAFYIILCAAALTLTGCGQREAPDMAATTSSAQAAKTAAEEIDLTSMSSTMVYSYVFNMINTPDDYIGQRFRIRGTYDEEYWDQTELTYHYIVIADATSCCTQGLEFVLTDPDAVYPQLGEEFEITGFFGTYEGNGNRYIQIVADAITTPSH